MTSPRKKIVNNTNTPPRTTAGRGGRAGRREWIGLAVIALPCLLYSMDLTVLHLAVPQLSEQLQPTSAQLLWIIDIYGFLVAGSLVTMGTLGDRIGRRKLLLIGAAAFGIASVIAAFSTTTEMLIASRALLGIAGATVAPSTLSLIRNMFLDPQQRTAAIGVWITSYSVGGAFGIAFFGSLGIAVYRNLMAGEVPAGIPVTGAQTAMDTLGGAIAIAEQLPDQLGSALVSAARGAYIQGLQLSMAISAVGAIIIAVLVMLLLREVGADPSAEEHSDLVNAAPIPGDD